MPIDKEILRLVKREKALQKSNITSDELFQSKEYKNQVTNLVKSLTGKYKVPINIYFSHDMKNSLTAGTDGKMIMINTGNNLIQSYETLENKYYSSLGMLFHEVGHILFCDFDKEFEMQNTLKSGKWFMERPNFDDEEKEQTFNEIESCLKDQNYASVISYVFGSLANCIADPHDEDKMINSFGSLINRGIGITREALWSSIVPFETMFEKGTPIEIAMSIALQYARFGEFYALNIEKANKTDIVKTIRKIAIPVDIARNTDSPEVKAEQIGEILLILWQYIKEAVEEQEERENFDGSDTSENDSQSKQSNTSQGSNGSQNSETEKNGNESESENESENGNGNGSKNRSQSMSEETMNEILKQIKNAENSSGQTKAQQNAKSSNIAKEQTKNAMSSNSSQNSEKEMTSSSSLSSGDGNTDPAFDNLLNEIATNKAEENVQDGIINDNNIMINAVSQNSTHKGKKAEYISNNKITQNDIDTYNHLMKDLKGYSKRLQRYVLEELKDLQDGSISHKKILGNRLESKNMYRPDQRFYANRKQPQDFPDMAISVLVDLSGSMCGERLRESMRMAMLLYDFATALDIPVAVNGHNTYADNGIAYHSFTDYRKVNDKEKYRLAQMEATASNRDGMAIEISANMLSKRPEDVKLLFIISDGQPNDYGYGGELAKEDIQSIVKRYKKQGIEVFALAIGSDKENIKEIYGESSFIDIKELDKLPKKMATMLRKRILG